jgi:hypothetical protein
MAVTINASTTTGLVQTADTSGVLQLQTNSGTTAVTIDTSQNVGIGTASPTYKLHVANSGFPALGVFRDLDVGSVGTAGQGIEFGARSGSTFTPGATITGFLDNPATTGGLQFLTRSSNTLTERMRLTSDGNLALGATGTTHKFIIVDNVNRTEGTGQLSITGDGYSAYHWMNATAYYIGQNSGAREVRVYAGSTPTTGVRLTPGATSWASTSDENLKDIIEPITDAANKVSTLRAVIGKYKTDEEETRRPFLIAQDVEKVLPEAVHIGSDDTLTLSYTETIPLLVAAIQEQQTIINDLKARIETLEAK